MNVQLLRCNLPYDFQHNLKIFHTHVIKGCDCVCLPLTLVCIPAVELGVSENMCAKEVTHESTGEFLTLGRHGPGSCLQTLLDFLSSTHNSLVREARRVSHQEDRSVQQLAYLDETKSTPAVGLQSSEFPLGDQ